MAKPKLSRRVPIVMEPALYTRIKQIAEKKFATVSYVIREALREYTEKAA